VKNRLLLAIVATLAVAGLGWLSKSYRADEGPRERPTLALLTSLPLVFGEQMSLEAGGSAALTRLERTYQVVPINVADAASLKGKRLLLMAQPRAQPAEALVDLDRWVHRGGRLLLLADPQLDWPSQRPLGDALRPPPMFADTGLLRHWGLTLSAAGLAGPECDIADEGLIARCSIGRGQATVVADADFINVESPDAPALDLMVTELGRLGTR
jgi:hypothetical protein